MSLRSRLAHFEVMLSLTPWKGRHAAARELTCSHSLYHCNKKWKNSSFNFALIYFVQSCIEKVQNKTNFYLIIFFSKVRSKFIVIWVWSTILSVIRIILIIFILIVIRNAQTCNKRKKTSASLPRKRDNGWKRRVTSWATFIKSITNLHL